MSRERIFLAKMMMASDMQDGKYPSDVIKKHVRDAILEFGADTEENLNCADHVTYGAYYSEFMDATFSGLQLKSNPILLSTLSHISEGGAIPDGIKAELPFVTQAEWKAFTRLITLMLTGLETYKPSPRVRKSDEPYRAGQIIFID